VTGEFAVEQAGRFLGELAVQIKRARGSRTAERVHDLRVAVRRFKSVLQALEPCFPGESVRAIRVRLKGIMGAAGDVRDRDIAAELVGQMDAPESGLLASRFRSERKKAAAVLSGLLKGWVDGQVAAEWGRVLAAGGGEAAFCARPVLDSAGSAIRRVAEKQLRRGKRALREDAPPKKLHRLRIATKEFRYTIDLFLPVLGGSAEGLLDELKELQTLLGDINDLASARRLVETAGGPGGIAKRLKKKQRKKIRKFRKAWSDRLGHVAKKAVELGG
jgi:CHAD domain-containing protein